jgi:eukaryotic-like serine/threonine-protein kinase
MCYTIFTSIFMHSITLSYFTEGETMPFEGLQLGHYRLLRLIGSGGMGEVYLAEDTRINRQLAIKVVRMEATPYPDVNATKETARLFQREMRAITMLDHPHILPLIDFGEENVNKIILTYMVMPFRQEGSLADWLQQRSSAEILSPQDVAHLIYHAADALQHAHDHQLIHQDVKPSNFLIRSRAGNPGRPDLLLADFGIVKFTTATATASQSIRGTPAYMAPEQWDGQPVPATDQYALAIMAYQLLTGRPPFQGGPGQVMRQHFMALPQPPGTLNPRISPALDAVILRALEKSPQDRFPSITAFAQAFQEALQGAETHSTAKAQSSARGADIRATLAISRTEAQTGTSRALTLPGGRKVRVSVPAGTQDGQVIHLEGQGELSSSGGPAGTLVLTIAVKQPEEADLASNIGSVEKTARASNPDLQRPVTVPPNTNLQIQGIVSLGPVDIRNIISPLLLLRSRKVLLIGLALLVVVGGLVFFYFPYFNYFQRVQLLNAAPPDPYATSGSIALNDPLRDNSNGYFWGSNDSHGTCQFAGGAYQVGISQGYSHYCTASTTNFSNFTYEVTLTILQGDCGGIIFRGNDTNGTGYLFWVCQDGTYAFYLDTSSTQSTLSTSSSSSVINTGLGQSNVIAVVANGSTLDLYVNQQKIDSVSDSTYNHGQIGVDATSLGTATEVVFRNARVWTL